MPFVVLDSEYAPIVAFVPPPPQHPNPLFIGPSHPCTCLTHISGSAVCTYQKKLYLRRACSYLQSLGARPILDLPHLMTLKMQCLCVFQMCVT